MYLMQVNDEPNELFLVRPIPSAMARQPAKPIA